MSQCQLFLNETLRIDRLALSKSPFPMRNLGQSLVTRLLGRFIADCRLRVTLRMVCSLFSDWSPMLDTARTAHIPG